MATGAVFNREVFVDLRVEGAVGGVDDPRGPTGGVFFGEKVANVAGDF